MTQGSRSVRLVIVVAVLVGALAFFIGRISAPDAIDSPDESAQSSSDVPSPSNDESGAVASATAYARVLTGPSEEPDEYRAAVLAIAAPQWEARAGELADNAIEFVGERYGSDGRVDFYPVRYKVQDFSPEEATIDIWGTVLASGSQLSGTEESWITGTLNLVWIDNEWKVNGQSSSGGPTPEGLRTEGEAATPSELEGFEEYEDAPRP